jgi:iron complex outermembrane receptor protein
MSPYGNLIIKRYYMKMRSQLNPLVTGLILALGGTASFAQNNSSLALEEVLVTATKREQNMQDVAVAVTALGADLIKEAQINSSEDLTFLVPSLNLQKGSNPRQTSFSIRGIGTQSFSSAAEPSVSTMVDGVVMGRSGQSFMQLLDVQRVEVLRGPQGTLFGKNSTAGVVHIITENPTEEHTGELMGTIVSDEEYRAGLTISGPISDDLGYRLTANGNDMAGYTKNYYDGDYLNGKEDWSVRGKLRWLPTDTIELKWASDYSDVSCDCTASPIRSLDPFGGNEDDIQAILDNIAPVQLGEENEDVNINQIPFSDSKSWGHSLEVNWDIGEFILTSITAARGFEVNGFDDVDSQPIDTLGFDQFGASEQEQFTQEFRITSPEDGVITYVAGLFYFDQEVKRRFRRDFEIVPGSPGIAVADMKVDTKNWAAFGEATWNFSDTWRLIAGVRYTEDELDFVFSRTVEGLPIALPDPVEPTKGGTDEDDVSGKLALQWDYSDQGMTYLSFAQGYKGPAFDMAFGADPIDLPRVDPETSDSWELGLKTSLFDGQVRLNAALFYSEYQDFQSQAYFDPDGVPPSCPDDNPGCNEGDDPGSFILINAGEVTTQGLEVDFLAQVTDNLRLSGGVAFIDAKIDSYPGGPCSGGQNFRGECPNGLQDLSGGDLPFSPKWKANLTASYILALDNSFDVVLKGSVRAQDEVLYSLTQDENTIQDGYSIFDASVVFEDHSDRWDATIFVKNIGDEFYASSIFSNNAAFLPNGYNQRYSKLAGRTYGLEMRYRWF